MADTERMPPATSSQKRGKRQRVVATLPRKETADFWAQLLTKHGFRAAVDDQGRGKHGGYRILVRPSQLVAARDFKRGVMVAFRTGGALPAFMKGLLFGIDIVEGRQAEWMRHAALAGCYRPDDTRRESRERERLAG